MALAHAPGDPNKIPMSVEEYFRLDAQSENTRYEYIDGYAVAMAGGSNNHSLIGLNIGAELRSALRDTPCRAYNADIYMQVAEDYFHPDITVSCDEEDRANKKGVRHPKIIVEVLSPGTENYDRHEKFRSYRTIPTLEEYVIISSQIVFIEVFRREGDIWGFNPFGPGDIVELTSVNAQIPIEHIYEKVEFSEEQ